MSLKLWVFFPRAPFKLLIQFPHANIYVGSSLHSLNTLGYKCQKLNPTQLEAKRELTGAYKQKLERWVCHCLDQLILKEINPKHSLDGLMLKLKFQNFGHLMQRANSLEKTLMPGKIEGRKRSGYQRIRGLDGITNSMGMSLSKLQEM